MKGFRTEYYRIVIENGKVKVNIFDKGNPDPHYTLNTSIRDKKGRELVALFLQKYGMSIKDFEQIYKDQIESDALVEVIEHERNIQRENGLRKKTS